MKYSKIILAGAVLMLGLTSCKKFLEEDPQGQVTIVNYYKTEGDAISAVNSIYAYLNSISTGSTAGIYHSSFWVTAGLASDELENNQLASPQFDQLSTFTYNSQNSALQEIWETHYKAINVANIAIARIPGISMNAELKSRLLGEAKFLRGLLYFNMVRMFGDIPLLTAEENPLVPPISSAADIYTQVISDLTDAVAALPLNYAAMNGRGRATQGAANGLLSKVYLTMENWDLAATTAKKVIDSNEYELYPDYADVFKLSNRNGKEAIFSVGFGDANGSIIFWEAGQFQVRLLPPALSIEGVQNAQGWQIPTQYLYDQYDADDRRRAVTFITEIHDPAGPVTTIRPYIQKYWDRVAEPKGNESSNDFPVLRYADVLLIYAEANNELGEMGVAEEYINKIRKRARFNGTTDLNTVPDYSGLDQVQMRDAILNERLLEFVAEGHRWFDLARMGELEEKVPLAKAGITPAPRNYLFPIPQREIDLNQSLVQNNGY